MTSLDLYAFGFIAFSGVVVLLVDAFRRGK
jgi:hypothetical protein